jgi:hypothetical protein
LAQSDQDREPPGKWEIYGDTLLRLANNMTINTTDALTLAY